MAIDVNPKDGVDDVTGDLLNPDGTVKQKKNPDPPKPSATAKPGSQRGIGSQGASGGGAATSTTTVVNPSNARPDDTAWAPRVDRMQPNEYIYSTGAVAQEYAMIQNPWSSAYNTWQTKSQLEGSWVRLTDAERDLFNGIAAARGRGSTGTGVYADMISESVAYGSAQKSPVQIALEAVQSGRLPYAATGPGGPGSGGPRTTSSVSYMDQGSAEMLLNKLATDKLGRNLTDEELKQYTADFRKQESKNPTMTTSSSGSSVTEQGMADTDIANKILMKNPAFADNVLKTDVVDMFFNRIGGRNGGQ